MTRAKRKCETEKYKAKRRETKKLSMQRAREKLKQNPEKLEEARIKDRERKKAQRKKIHEMPQREQRIVRKQWRQCSKTYREKIRLQKQLENDLEIGTPPPSPQASTPPNTERRIGASTSRVESGKRKQRKNRKILKEEIKNLKEQNEILSKRVEKYRKRLQRSKSPKEITPRKKVKLMLNGQNCSTEIRKNLIFGEVLKKQINNHFVNEKSQIKKRCVASVLSGNIVKKYRMMTRVREIISRRTTTNKAHKDFKKMTGKRKDVTDFLSQDENSKQCAGKKETVTRNKIKMQKRLLTDSLQNLHKKFIATYQMHTTMSYSKFCKLRPFWITIPDCKNRDTCLCKIHTNMDLVVNKLHSADVINEKSSKEVLSALTCEGKTKELCLQRKCNNCKDRTITLDLSEDHKNDTISYFFWNTIDVEIEIKGKKKQVKKTVKEEIPSTKGKLVTIFNNLLKKFMIHEFNIKHQYSAIRQIKENLKSNEVLLQIDYSENYNCKFTDEVQSLHFGGSRNQATLHTSVMYYKDDEELKSACFCTVTEERRHDASAVCGHLKPIFEEIIKIIPNLSNIHFVSDGPSSQYRNRKMFVLVGEYLPTLLRVKSINWHYLEAGHGKGAADGVGGCLKRTADNLVAKGTDIPNVTTLVKLLNIHCPGIKVKYVPPTEILESDTIKLNVPQFKGTNKTHEICWTEMKKEVQVRSLSCLKCPANEKCMHFHIGTIKLESHKSKEEKRRRFNYSDVYSESENEAEAENMSKNNNANILRAEDIAIGDWIAVIYDNIWYPGTVENKLPEGNVDVNFMHRKNGNHLLWPSKKDSQIVAVSTILCKIGHPPYPVSSRQFKLKEEDYLKVVELFNNIVK